MEKCLVIPEILRIVRGLAATPRISQLREMPQYGEKEWTSYSSISTTNKQEWYTMSRWRGVIVVSHICDNEQAVGQCKC